ncbi:NlpC/P60 family protein [Asticcacaulis sp. EMRT-3]|uniref:NlpC/P60 family protein n=1 Tax=Asticcacaulis sp. EMRT-3 TaxID=3040349 RepID=UPI0024AECACC|nr:NlpC/P60 family protein [Asticcacaulis sp. EMRT-3]MDI7775376.1 NlpC/P60 family protein [Asticcacaulis sp. EMRT-3]
MSRIVAEARTWLGTPYRHQMSLKGVGCDCIGLVRGVWREVVGPEPASLPPYSPDWAEVCGQDWLLAGLGAHFQPVSVGQAQAGDVIAFRMKPGALAKHAAILSAGGLAASDARLIHAYWGHAVVESWLNPFWRQRVVGAFRFPLI